MTATVKRPINPRLSIVLEDERILDGKRTQLNKQIEKVSDNLTKWLEELRSDYG